MNSHLNPNTVKSIYKVVGKQIKKIRIEKHITQSELAFRCYTDASKIGKAERGQHELKFTTILAISKAFDIKIEKFLPLDILNSIIDNLWQES